MPLFRKRLDQNECNALGSAGAEIGQHECYPASAVGLNRVGTVNAMVANARSLRPHNFPRTKSFGAAGICYSYQGMPEAAAHLETATACPGLQTEHDRQCPVPVVRRDDRSARPVA